jgi:transcriptional regulator with XRE-family HTH domain
VGTDINGVGRRASEAARSFGSLIRSRRQALAMSQDQLALATGVGRRFLIELEAGKPSCHLGRSLIVAEALGLQTAHSLGAEKSSPPPPALDFPDIPAEEEPNG